MTNGDKIRNMTDEELVRLCFLVPCFKCIHTDCKRKKSATECENGIRKWLQQEIADNT